MTLSPYQPQYHFFPGQGFMNDPNGLIYYQGEYHLFYQHLWPRNWGHAVSNDLVHWEILPIALKPDELGDIWSGSVVADHENSSGFFAEGGGLVAIFTHQNSQRVAPLGPQIQSIAYSSDRGRSWTMYEQNPVIANSGENDFRDPQVFWHASSNAWVMVVTFKGDRVRIYRSANLNQWELASEFGVGMGDHSGVWECPNLFEMVVDGESQKTFWVLHISLCHFQEMAKSPPDMQYFLGHFDGFVFENADLPEIVHWSEYGKDNYAAISWSDIPVEDGRRIWIGWGNNWHYAEKLPTGEWQGMMTIPRELRLKTTVDGIRLFQQPIAELQALRETAFRLDTRLITSESEVTLPIQGRAVEITAVFRVGSASEFGLRVRKGENQETLVGYDVARSSVYVDRSRAGESAFHVDFPGRHSGPLLLPDGMLRLQIFVDASSIEVFANDGEVVISDLIFPDPESQGLQLYAIGGTVELCSLEIYGLLPGSVVRDAQ